MVAVDVVVVVVVVAIPTADDTSSSSSKFAEEKFSLIPEPRLPDL